MALPKDKEDITAYYFYRLIQSASKVFLIYNTQTDKFGAGEPSRYIAQIKQELSGYSPAAKITEELFQNKFISPKTNEIKIEKTDEIIEVLKSKFEKGFSPSSLSTYISCSLKFFFSKIIGIEESETVEEDIELNTLGTAIHETLRFIYEDFGSKFLKLEDFKSVLSNLESYLKKGFAEAKVSSNLMKSKNLISYEIAKEMTTKLIKQDLESLKNNEKLKIELLEQNISMNFEIKANEKKYSGKLKGIVDRVDSYNNQIRVIDYKTGNVDFNAKGEIATDSEKLQIGIFENYKDFKEKAFQLLFYSYLFRNSKNINSPLTAAIYALKH
jgi:ATP-dependent exoDNAse (exonuclease V) beta subunit